MIKKRNTPAKQAILAVLRSANAAMRQEAIEQELALDVDRVTIYRVLNGFCEDGLVHRIVADDGRQYFALCRNCNEEQHVHDHYHFRCVSCHKLECLDQPVSAILPAGYRLGEVNCILTGTCAGCA